MKIRLALLLIAACAAAPAQRSNGYIFAAPGAATDSWSSTGTLQIGGGGEFAIAKGFAAGADIGVVAPPQCWSGVLGVFSPGVSYHFIRNPRRRLDPFLSGGYTLMFRDGHAGMGHFGAGLNYWFHPKAALRVEFRDHVRSDYGQAIHFWGVRMGFAFR